MHVKYGNLVIGTDMDLEEDGKIHIRWGQHISQKGDLISIGFFSQRQTWKKKKIDLEAMLQSRVQDHARERTWTRFKLREVINDPALLAYTKYGKEGIDWRWVRK